VDLYVRQSAGPVSDLPKKKLQHTDQGPDRQRSYGTTYEHGAYEDAYGRFQSRLRAANGEIVTVSVDNAVETNCSGNIAYVGRNTPNTGIAKND